MVLYCVHHQALYADALPVLVYRKTEERCVRITRLNTSPFLAHFTEYEKVKKDCCDGWNCSTQLNVKAHANEFNVSCNLIAYTLLTLQADVCIWFLSTSANLHHKVSITRRISGKYWTTGPNWKTRSNTLSQMTSRTPLVVYKIVAE